MKLWIDDIRPAPEGWTRAETISEAVVLLCSYTDIITHISFDHDISIPVKVKGEWYNRPSPDTFKVVALFCVAIQGLLRDDVEFTTHSSNPDGRKSIRLLMEEAGFNCKETPAEVMFRNNDLRD